MTATKLGQKRKPAVKRSVGRPIRGRRGLQAKADRLMSQLVFKLADYKCQWCGKAHGQLHNHHAVVGRRYLNTRYELDNCVCLAASCHRYLTDHPTVNADWMRKRIGSERVDELIRLAHTYHKLDYKAVLEKLEAETAPMEFIYDDGLPRNP